MTERHRVSQAQLTDLASGTCAPDTLHLLREAELSRRLLLIRHIADTAPGNDDAVAVIDMARERDRESATDVITDPMAGAWLASAVRRLRAAEPTEADLGQLAALAAVAAARCGADADLPMTYHGSTAMLPTIGLVGGLPPDGTVRLLVRGGRVEASDGRWQHLRRLTGGPQPVVLDALSPYRDVFHAPARRRLSDADAERWQHLFTGAGRILFRYAGERAARAGAVVRTIVPLRRNKGPLMLSATARHVFGALGATMPASAATLGVTLVHEGHHSILNGVLQLEALFDPKDPTLYFAPWRRDPRPIRGLLHGVYAFLGTADLMNRLRADPAQERAAEKQFAKICRQLRPALDSLRDAPGLTEPGRQFAKGMEEELSRLEMVPVSREAADFATRSMNDDRARWQRRNGRAESLPRGRPS
ncbi:aKG-HExxH-type peptide beta-hydroxylase [Actinoplanes sp. CA-030573]|uniref:aKG-HExxH-type peptide beta-hydroxylase n=1 Tax=Actinoplanes sp. CA-030573 TaxID=3239898 RepID=UPI003D907CBF